MRIYKKLFDEITNAENLFSAWDEFKRGKRNKPDVLRFEKNLEQNIFALCRDLQGKTYRHGPYDSFYIQDPKIRHIHKATVRDRVLHHAVFSVLNPTFEPTFISDSYACRKGKGTHKGVYRLKKVLSKVGRNNHKSCFALKCDIKKFFESVNHQILCSTIERRVKDPDALWLINETIESFSPGVPIGNLTSQLFANIYLNELDQFMKHELHIPFYLRYTDDFVIVSTSKEQLERWLPSIQRFLTNTLKLELHPRKIILRKYRQGVDFLGYVQFPYHRILRTKTKRRILKRVGSGVSEQALQSYLGVLSHANAYKLSQEIKNLFWFSK